MTNFFKSAYHAVLPAEVRGRIGLGSSVSRALHRRKAKLISQLECHSPFSAGSVPQRYELTLGAAGSCYSTLLDYLIDGDPGFMSRRRVSLGPADAPLERQLASMLIDYGSDKASSHSYHYLYSRALNNPEGIRSLLEIGIGTNNPAIVSNMTEAGRPGASLRAWQDFLPEAKIIGADIDPKILFSEGRIRCSPVDQLDLDSLFRLAKSLPCEQLDVIIDDGLHSTQANLHTIQALLPACSEGGWFFVEDIFPPQIDFFLALSWILDRQGIQSRLYEFDKPGAIFAISPGRSLDEFPV